MKKISAILSLALIASSSSVSFAQFQNSGDEGWKPAFIDDTKRESVQEYRQRIQGERTAQRIAEEQMKNNNLNNNIGTQNLNVQPALPPINNPSIDTNTINQQINSAAPNLNANDLKQNIQRPANKNFGSTLYPNASANAGKASETIKQGATELKNTATEGFNKLKGMIGN